MKKYGSASSSSKNMDQLFDNTNPLSLDTTTLVVQKNATKGCQHFAMCGDPNLDQYYSLIQIWITIWITVGGEFGVICPKFGSLDHCWRCPKTWENDLKARNPLEEKNYQRLAAQLSTLQLCPSIEHRASGDATEGEDSKAPIDGEIQEISSLEELARVAILLKEKEPAEEGVIITSTKVNDNVQSLKNCCRGHPYGRVNVNQRKTRFSRQEFIRPGETENAKRRSPFSQDTEVISRKRLKVTDESSCPCLNKQKGTFKRSGTGPNPLLRHIYEKLAARYMREPFTPPLKPEENIVTRHRDAN